MTAPTTQRDEVRQLLAASSEPLTRPAIFASCKLVLDENALSTVLCQLVKAGDIKRVGERAREKGAPLALYAIGSGGGTAPTSAGGAKRKGVKGSKRRRASGSKPPRSTAGSRRVPKVQRNTATAAPKGGKSIEKVSRKTPPAPAPEGFRCGIFSDGTLAINAEDGQLTLSEPETRAMFKYMDRVLGSEAA